MLGSDIGDVSMTEALLQAEITQWENMLAETDAKTFPRKIQLIQAKLAQLRRSLANAQARIGSAGAMAALQQDTSNWAEQEYNAGRADVRLDPVTGNIVAYSTGRTWEASPTYSDMTPNMGYRPIGGDQAYRQFNVTQYSPTYEEGATYGQSGGYRRPGAVGGNTSWMQQGYLTPYGDVAPLGAQSQLGALQQAQLWEYGATQGANTIEEYLEREPYIQTWGEEYAARSKALHPKTYQRKAQWERALQR